MTETKHCPTIGEPNHPQKHWVEIYIRDIPSEIPALAKFIRTYAWRICKTGADDDGNPAKIVIADSELGYITPGLARIEVQRIIQDLQAAAT